MNLNVFFNYCQYALTYMAEGRIEYIIVPFLTIIVIVTVIIDLIKYFIINKAKLAIN